MKYLLVTAACFLSQPAAAQMLTVDEALAIKARASSGAFTGRAEWNAFTFYLQGTVEAAMSYRDALEAAGEKPLFCPAKGGSESMESILAMLERAEPEDRSKGAAAFIVEGFAKKYPCKE